VLGAVLALVAVPPSLAQEARGSISGTVKDNSGGALPGVTVTATQKETNRATSTVTNETGAYTLLYLQPGIYAVTAELSGFKKTLRDNIEIRVNDRMGIDLTMEIGGLEETVTVLAESPLLETRSGSQGQIIDEKRISLLPLSDGNPFVLTRLAPGIAYFGDLKFSRPFDNGGTSDVSADGAPGRNEFTLDGSPNMASGGRVAYVPPSDAVQEFKVESATFDAQQGHTAGATVNVAIKSGTNSLRGTGYFFYRDEKLSANEYFLEKAGKPKSLMDYTRWGGTMGGPIMKDKTFFFGVFERLDDALPEPEVFTVPTAAQLNGDFSALLSQGILIYDPATAFLNSAGRVERLPFPGNVVPANRISAIAKNYAKYYPAPNRAGDAQGRNNYQSEQTRTDDFYAITARVDHQITEKQRIFIRWSKNDRREARSNWTGEISGVNPTGNYLFRKNDQVTIDHVWTMSAGMLLNLRCGYALFQEPNIRQHEGVFDPASLGWSPGVVQYFQGAQYMPRFEIGGMSVLGQDTGANTKHGIWSFQPTLTKASGAHSFRMGWDWRVYEEYGVPARHSAGRYDFNTDFTRQYDNSPAAPIGQQLAAMLLGQTTGGIIARSADRYNETRYQGLFFQDDWRVNSKLTLNLGLRYEYEGATTERDNRNVRGFDPAASLTITSAAQAAYAANPIPEVSPSAFKVLGGLGFADDSNRGFYVADKNNWQPRLGMAYSIDDKTVLRAGYAVYSVPAVIWSVRQSGFSQDTNIVPSNDNGLTFVANLANPFPSGVADPPGASLGPNTFAGRQLDRWEYDVESFKNPQAMRWSISVQRELPKQWVVEAAYVGNRSYDIQVELADINPVPRSYLSTSPSRDQTTINYLTTNVTNPFRGLLPGTSLNGNTVQRQQLLRPYPHLANIQSYAHDGTSDYNSLQGRVEKRFTSGYTVLLSYTWSKFTERVSQLNSTDSEYEERLANADMPHRLVVSGIYELPFGRGRKWGSDWNRALDAIAGGWSIQAIYQAQSGRPVGTWGNLYYNGDVNGLKADYSKVKDGVPIFDTSGFYFHDAAVQTNGVDDPAKQRNDQRIRLAQNVRYFPTRVSSVKQQALNLMDLSFVKKFQFTDRVRAQFHVEKLNAFDQPVFNIPNLDPTSSDFGKVTSTLNLPLNVQIAFKLVF
jgi:hypothetical protein